jgi:putative membrane protein
VKKLVIQIVAGIVGIYLAEKFVPGVSLEIIPGQSSFWGITLTAFWQILIFVGAVLGLLNFLLKPLLRIITFPLRVLTLGLFGFVLNMFLVWLVDILFLELEIQGLIPLFWTTLIVWLISIILGLM